MTELKIEMSTAASSSPNRTAEREKFLEEYGRNMARLLDTAEGFIALQELLSGDESRDVHLTDSGRSGLALILKLLGDEAMDAWGSLPTVGGMERLLQEGPRHE